MTIGRQEKDMKDIGTFNIAICDDVKLWHREIADSCKNFFGDKEVGLNFYSYYSGEEIVKERSREIDLLFLDIEMGKLSGLDALAQIEMMPNIKTIIFVTSHPEAAIYAYGFKPVGFITKPINADELHSKLGAIYSRMMPEALICFSDNGGTFHYRKSDILYVEADSSYCNIHSNCGTIVVSHTLKKCEETLCGMPFLRVHKSYVVNLDYVKNMNAAEINLLNDEKIPIGRSYKADLRRNYQKYLIMELNA